MKHIGRYIVRPIGILSCFALAGCDQLGAADAYLQNIVASIVDQVDKNNVGSFRLAGHSMGIFNSRGLVCAEFFRDKVDATRVTRL